MKTPLLLALSLLPATAEIIGVEQFDYPDGPIATKDGGTFWDYKNFTPTGHTGFVSNWDDLSGAPAVTSGRLVTNGTSAKREYNGSSPGATTDDFAEAAGAVNDPASVPSSVSKKVYYRVDVTTGATLPGFFGISSYDFGTEKLFFGKRNGQPKFGIEELGVGATDSTTTPDILPNTTYTLVVRIDYDANLLRLFVDPDLNALEESQFTASNRAYTGTNWSTAVRLASGGGGSAVTWDNLVATTTWEDLGTVVTTTANTDNGSLDPALGGGVSLREAVNHSPSGTLITFAPALGGQTCALGGTQLLIDRSLTIDASSLSGSVTVSGNHASRVINIASGASLTLRNLSIIDGNTGEGGGGILNSGTCIVQSCTFSGNRAGGNGGAIVLGYGSTMSGCTFTDNSAEVGGACYAGSGDNLVTHCTFNGNRAQQGGAIYVYTVSLTLAHCTLAGNHATQNGGGIYNEGEFDMRSCIVAGNTAAGSGPDIDKTHRPINLEGVNLLSSLEGTNFIVSANLIIGQPLLSPLGYFGGPTMTMHPLIGSPAIDAAGSTDPGTDARGFPRFVDGNAAGGAQLDIGAVEAGPLRTVDSVGGPSPTGLRATLVASTEPGARIAFSSSVFPATPIEDIFGELTIAADRTFFIDASNLSGPVTISGRNLNRVFSIPATATVAMHSLKIVNGKATDGPDVLSGTAENGASGGGILSQGYLSLFSCSVTGNRAGNGGDSGTSDEYQVGGEGGDGGGIWSSGTLRIVSSTIHDNRSGNGGSGFIGGDGGGGGGISSNGPLHLISGTIAGNVTGAGGTFIGSGTLGGFGGGIFIGQGSVVEHSTISGNSSPGFGGGISTYNSPVPLKLRYSVVAGNSSVFTGADILGASVTSEGANLVNVVEDIDGPIVILGIPPLTGNPLLAPLGNYSGLTQTMPPLPGSPAINAATASSRRTDQRGLPIVGLPDIGAAEYQGTPDLRLFWNTDGDGDGNAFGVEHALGTNPALADPANTRNLSAPVFGAPGQASLAFGRDLSATPGTISILKRSPDLITFTEIFRITGNTVSNALGISATVNTDSITVLDSNPPPGKAFYRIEAVSP